MDTITYGVKLYENNTQANKNFVFAYYKNGKEVGDMVISNGIKDVKDLFFRLVNYISQDMCIQKMYNTPDKAFEMNEMLLFEDEINNAKVNGRIMFCDKTGMNLIGEYSSKRDGYCFYSPLREPDTPVFMGEVYNKGDKDTMLADVRKVDFPEYKWASYKKLENLLIPENMSDEVDFAFYSDKPYYFLFNEKNGFIYRPAGHVKVWAKDKHEALEIFFKRFPEEKKWAIREDEFSVYNLSANLFREQFPMSFNCIADEETFIFEKISKYSNCIAETKRGDFVYGCEENSKENSYENHEKN